MPRERTGYVRRRRHNKIIKMVKGQWGSRGRLFRRSNEALIRSLFYAYRDRRNKKRDLRGTWITRINAAARENGTTYAHLIAGLKKNGISLDRKVLAELAATQPAAFSAVVKAATKK